jgi:sugar O-acyltransferase (sialic acid O-acetyltransferase NeuD family)
MNCVFGTGGFARELDWLLDNLKRAGDERYTPTHFIEEDGSEMVGGTLKGCPVIAEWEFYARTGWDDVNCFVALATPRIRRKVVDRLRRDTRAAMPSIVDPSVLYDRRPDAVRFGEGSVVCARSVVEPDVDVGDHVHVNMGCTIGHQTRLGAFSTISPGVHLAGNVDVGEDVFIGTGAVVLERLRVCAGARIGAGAVVIADIVEPGTYVGVPAVRRDRAR